MSERTNSNISERAFADSGNRKGAFGRWVARAALIGAGVATAFGGIVASEAATGSEVAAHAFGSGANGAEKAWCRWPSRWRLCQRAQELANQASVTATSVAQQTGLSPHNGSPDAFRHCYWSGLLTQEFGWETAKGFGDRHEYKEGQHSFELRADLHNNRQGRVWAQQATDIGARCLQGMQNGELQVVVPFR